jgi:hypothetical protein
LVIVVAGCVALGPGTWRRRWWPAVVGLLLGACLIAPAAASITVAYTGEGPFDTPFQPAAQTAADEAEVNAEQAAATAYGALLAQHDGGVPPAYVAAVETSGAAAPQIAGTGLEFLPIGGYLGGLPAPTLAQLQTLIADGQLQYFYVVTNPIGTDGRILWIVDHCVQSSSRPALGGRITFAVFRCTPQDVG